MLFRSEVSNEKASHLVGNSGLRTSSILGDGSLYSLFSERIRLDKDFLESCLYNVPILATARKYGYDDIDTLSKCVVIWRLSISDFEHPRCRKEGT